MIKERLEEIKNVSEFQIDNDSYYGRPANVILIGDDVKWLIEQAERVQELDSKSHQINLLKDIIAHRAKVLVEKDREIEELKKQNKRYRELLEKIKEMTRYDDCREAEIYELVSDELEGEE